MRVSSLGWLAVAPLLMACAAGGPAADDDSGGPAIVRRPVPADDGEGSKPGPGTSSGGTPGASGNACVAQPACNGTSSPPLGAVRPFTHSIVSNVTVAAGAAYHRGRDQILSAGDAQWVIGKFTYSLVDKDLTDEDVDIYVERGCAGAWEKLGTTKTTNDGDHATVEGVEDSGGRVYFQIPKAKELAVGSHRVRLVVAGDQTSTDLRIDVLPKGSPVVVSDVDGTLTESETAEYPALREGNLPAAHPRAADALSALAAKGYHMVYLTARPEWLTGRTHAFLAANGFPPGVVHTTTGLTGALGGAAATFKSAELAALAAHGHAIGWAFGNKGSDADAYAAAEIPLDQRVFLRLTDSHGGRRIEAYSEILPVIAAAPAACK